MACEDDSQQIAKAHTIRHRPAEKQRNEKHIKNPPATESKALTWAGEQHRIGFSIHEGSHRLIPYRPDKLKPKRPIKRPIKMPIKEDIIEKIEIPAVFYKMENYKTDIRSPEERAKDYFLRR